VAAAVADDRDPVPPQRLRPHLRVDQVDHLVGRLHDMDARGPRGRGDDRAVADERAGVRAGGADAGLGRADGQQDDRLARGGGRVDERAAVAEVLGVDGDRAGLGMLAEGGHELGQVDVGLVADRREAGEPEPRRAGQDAQLERQVAALGDEPDRPGRELVRGQPEIRGRVVDAEAVGPEQHRAGIAHASDELPLARARLVAALAEAGGDPDQRPGAGGERVVDRLLEGRRRHGDNHQLGRVRQLGQRAVGAAPEHGPALAVHQVHGAAVLTPEGAAAEPVAPFGGVVGRTDDCHRARVEEGSEVSCHRAYARMKDPPRGVRPLLAGPWIGCGPGEPRQKGSDPGR
jgi:hypothetical protein